MSGVLYKKEREVLEFLAQFQRQYGYSPTLSEIAQGTGHRSNSTVHTLIKSLVDKGYVQKVDGNTRVLKIVDDKVTLSLMGSKPAVELKPGMPTGTMTIRRDKSFSASAKLKRERTMLKSTGLKTR